ncbi:AAA family ATPase [Propionibacterium acidifaciens]|uniref:AAA family ATPase n=1 Tax=Propionibacterium acidifaciens TaxID=556499 RepID=UPI003987DA23
MHEASDGTLRFICLATLLLGPDLPATVVLDEPELGLHPAAIGLLAEMARIAGRNGHKVILATQSVPLVSHFELGEIVVLNRVNGATEAAWEARRASSRVHPPRTRAFLHTRGAATDRCVHSSEDWRSIGGLLATVVTDPRNRRRVT